MHGRGIYRSKRLPDFYVYRTSPRWLHFDKVEKLYKVMELTHFNYINQNKFPCPCCGYLVFGEPPGSYEICPFCFWEDDLLQLRFVTIALGPNHISLVEGQKNYQKLGVCETRLLQYVKQPSNMDKKEPLWRLIDPDIDNIEEFLPGKEYGNFYPDDSTTLYYWRPTYWRKK